MASGEPIAALARNEIIHHETLLALAAALVAVSVLTLAALRNPASWVASIVPVASFITLTAALTSALDLVVNSAMLAAVSTAAALLTGSAIILAGQLTGVTRAGAGGAGSTIRAAMLPPIVLASAVAPLAISTRPPVAELGVLMALMLAIAAALCTILTPAVIRWIGRLGH
jgi:hypothetical protein